jgi:hypothetical protein
VKEELFPPIEVALQQARDEDVPTSEIHKIVMINHARGATE